ncbi:hypothetical protein Ocin01_01292 [Orchesella cincta]|uniref:Uncharacterized protein n=1 Tax=Orchesella cincta TaxID=48709 RepID=A0A1D2NJJ4_ORCCI|nr:hypothetical protein Ocin01_01292 [Orchesella cincta]
MTRKHIPIPRNLMLGIKKSKAETATGSLISQNGRRETSRDLEGLEVRSASSMCPSPVQEQCSEEDKSSETSQSQPMAAPRQRIARTISNNLLLRRWSSFPPDNDESGPIQLRNGIGSSSSLLPRTVFEQEMKWVLYSIWNQTLECCLKCENGKLPMEAEQFRELIIEIIDHVTPFPDFYKSLKEFKVICVERTEVVEDSASKVYGTWCCSTTEEAIGDHAEIRPTPLVIGELLSSRLSPLDLLVLLRSNDSNCNSFNEEHPCIIHVSYKDYNKLDRTMPNHIKLDSVSPAVQSEKNEVVHEEYGSYVIEKYLSLHDIPECERIPLECPDGPLAIALLPFNDFMDYESRDDVANPSSSTSTNVRGAVNGETLPTNNNRESTRDNDVMEQEVLAPSPCSDPDEIFEESDEDNGSLVDHVTPKRCGNFSLVDWVKKGNFVPGSLRPKLQKTDKKKCYEYHKLSELGIMLYNSVAEDRKNELIPNMMVKQQCYTYGVVVEVLQEVRHHNSYFFRISDETMESALVRMQSINKTVGPKIHVGQIIRLHRLTVQVEWDVGISENAMVLSTCAHHNYVIFKLIDGSNQFSYDTCAKTITLCDNDKLRVAELQMFKINRLKQSSNGVTLIDSAGQLTSTIKDIESFISANLRKPDSSDHHNLLSQSNVNGICDSDLASPMISQRVSFSECSKNGQSGQCSQELEEMVHDTEESYVTAMESQNNIDETSLSHTGEDILIDQEQPFVSPEVSPHEDTENPSSNESPSLRNFTLFKNLRKTDERLNLLCQIVTLGATSNINVWHLVIKDLECTSPSEEFKRPVPVDSQQGDDFMELNIINFALARSLEARNIVSTLYNDQGTDQFYAIEDVKVKGDEPPYALEVDGKTCMITRYNQLMQYLHLEESFSCSRPLDSEPDVVDTADDTLVQNGTSPISLKQPNQHSTPVSSPIRSGVLVQIDLQEPNSQSSQSSSVYLSAQATPSPTRRQQSVAEVFGENQLQTVVRKLEVWTGRPKGKRKPREHYQPEDSFEG